MRTPSAPQIQRAVIYVSGSNWAPRTRPSKPLAEQAEACRAAIEKHPELKRCATYRNRYDNGGAGDYRKILEDAVNRRFDCIVVDGIYRFAPTERAAFFDVARFLVPAGFRIIDVAEGYDTLTQAKEYRVHIQHRLARMEANARRREANHGAQD